MKNDILALSLIGIIMLIMGALLRLPYDYYTLLRIVICGIAIYSAYKSYEMNKMAWAWTMGFIALLFNPLIIFHFSKGTWAIIDIISAIALAISIIVIRK